jgi:hypothetical protein
LHRILLSCKNAIPVQVEKALQILTWWGQSHLLKSHSQKPTLSTFNLMISICEKARLWRKALIVFRMLIDGGSGKDLGLQPNTNTFDLMVRACSTAKREDAPAIYESMKLCGIPELYCYTAANMKLQ